MSKTIAVTGANGFIGQAMVEHLNAAGYKVIALVRCMPEKKLDGVDYHYYDLKIAPDVKLFTNVDALIHLAFSFAKPEKGKTDINLAAAKNLLSLNLKRYIFVSSFSALANAKAYYGQCKYQLEALFDGHTIIRPGLVIGEGGLLLRLRKQVKSNPVVPMLAGGRQPTQIIVLSDLISAIEKLLDREIKGVFNLAYPKAITYKQMIELASSASKGKAIFISIPIPVMRIIIKIARFLGKSDISEDNLDGLLNSSFQATEPDLAKLEIKLPATAGLMKQMGLS